MYQKDAQVGNGKDAITGYSNECPRAGDTVTVVLNSNDATLSFKVNGVDQGPAYKNLPKIAVYGCVTLYDVSSSVLLLSKTVRDQFMPNSQKAVMQVTAAIGDGIPPEQVIEMPLGIRVTRNSLSDWNDGSMIVPQDTVVIGSKTQSTSPNIVRWSFITQSGVRNTFGIVKSSYDPAKDSYINKTDKGWGLLQFEGTVGHHGSSKAKYTNPFKKIGTIVDSKCSFRLGSGWGRGGCKETTLCL